MEGLRIAILPITVDKDSSWAYLAPGMREVILNWLKKNPFFRLLTIDILAGHDQDIPGYMERLQTDVLLTGDLRVEERIILRLQSHSTKYPTYKWEKTFVAAIPDFMNFGLQLTEYLQTVFPYQTNRQANDRPLPRHPTAFKNYLLGQHYFQRWERAYAELALQLFEEVIQEEPDFIPAYLGIAKATIFLVSRGYRNANTHYPKTIDQLDRMSLIDPTYGEIYIYKGIIQFFYLLDWDSAYRNLEKGLENFSEASEAYSQLSLFWYGLRKYDKAIEAIHIAMEYNPLSVSLLNMKGDVLLSAQRYKESVAVFQEILELQPGDKVALENLMYIAGLTNNKSRALHYLKLLKKDGPVLAIDYPRIGYIHAKFGFEKQTNELIALLKKRSSENQHHGGRLANIYCGLDDYENALPVLVDYFNHRMGILYALTDPQFMPVRKWKMYQQLEQQIQLSALNDLSDTITLQTDLKQTLTIHPKLLLYAKADSNYTEVVCYNNFRTETTVVRMALRDLLKQLPSNQFFHCHRSYLVNTNLTFRKTGNARGFVLTSPKYGFEIPVSRAKIAEMHRRIVG